MCDLKILYLTRPYSQHRSASYQAEFIKYIQKYSKAEIFTVPIDYSDTDKPQRVSMFRKAISAHAANVDLVMTGHHWLGDAPTGNIIPKGFEFLREIPKPKVAVINKEYARLPEKIKYFEENQFDLLISHHSDLDACLASNGLKKTIPAYRCLFGVDTDVWNLKSLPDGGNRDYDLFFSGILINSDWFCPDQALRLEIENRLFHKFGSIRLKAKRKRIFWNAYLSNKLTNKLNRAVRIPHLKYQSILLRSRSTLCTPSMGLITPRFFEALVCGSVPLINDSKIFSVLGSSSINWIKFNKDLSNFEAALEQAISLSEEPNTVDKNHQLASDLHTWDIRIKNLMEYIETCDALSQKK